MKIKITFLINLLIILCFSCQNKSAKKARSIDYTKFVNNFIGTGGHGHTFPGTTVPFGMVQLSPDTRTSGWDACGGYHYSDSSIIGFSHTHLSGTGIGDYGDILFMPFTGKTSLNSDNFKKSNIDYSSRFDHSTEKASPGYYAVNLLDYDIKVELTTTTRAGFHKYTFPGNKNSGIVIDLEHSIYNHKNIINEIRIISETEVEGYKRTQGWAKNHNVYFYARFNKPFTYKLYESEETTDSDSSIKSNSSKAILFFETQEDERILAKVGISSVDYAGAKNNLDKEIPHWDFEVIRQHANVEWQKQLGKIEVEGGTDDQKTIFYSSLYHASIHPSIFNDADGRYRGIDQEIYNAKGENVYTIFSLWDTFRAFHPLHTIIDPNRDSEFINTLLNKYEEGGILPKWELAGNYTGTMIGYHSVPVIVDSYMKGNRNFDVEKAYLAITSSARYDTSGILFPSQHVKERLMPKARYYNETYGFIPADLENESVSKALEYAYNDWCIALMARELGKEDDYNKFMDRSLRYRKYFDKETGFMRGKNRDGTWRKPFDPRFSRHRKDDYTEGNAFQWSWFVPHDVDGLVELMGGEKQFVANLDTLFSTSSELSGKNKSSDISGLIGQYAHGNEPSHHIAHLYNFVGQPWKTQALIDSIMSSLYFNAPDGLSGNEDCGQMSAWYVLNAMGFYSFCPGNPKYSLGRPIFDKVQINLSSGKSFIIKSENNSGGNKYVENVFLDGNELNSPFINHKDIIDGGVLLFEMGPSNEIHFKD
jgi:predicted alpha-1,2-mannosidase